MIGMRGIEELDHYEMLEVSRGATISEIDRAYRMAQETWADGSLALYSIFEKRDAVEIRARLDEAYRVLADPELRQRYDEAHRPQDAGRRGVAANGERTRGKALREVESIETRAADVLDVLAQTSDERREHHSAVDEESTGEFDGPRLRRTRLFRGFEIQQIADVTKVSGAHLRNIEEENFADLPAEVYVRGFVTAYARTIGLDPQVVLPSYMARLQESRQQSQRSRFLGLR